MFLPYLARANLGWVAVQELKLSYRNPESIFFTRYPYYGTLNSIP